MARLAEARAAKAAEEEKMKDMKAKKFGTHTGITCDGCMEGPIMGFRYRCLDCKNHDICEGCHEIFKTGVLKHENRANNVPLKAEAHRFEMFSDKTLKKMGSEGGGGPTAKSVKKTKPNELCPCGSGKKYKKCCMGKD